jgi:iron complex outermembrane receptor protein
MKVRTLISVIALLFFEVNVLIAQRDFSDTLKMREVLIQDQYTFKKSSVYDTIQSATSDETLGQLMERKGYAQVIAYGPPGQAATIRFQGMGSNYTSVSWNGLPLASLTMSIVDASLVQSNFFQTMEIQTSGNASINAMMPAGVNIALENPLPLAGKPSTRFEVKNTFNSLNNFGTTSRAEYRNSWLSLVSSVQFGSYSNHFRYNDRYKWDNPSILQQHNNANNTSFINEIRVKTGLKSSLKAGIWWTKRISQIPEIMGSYASSGATQADSSFRSHLTLERKTSMSELRITAGFIQDLLRYNQDERVSDKNPAMVSTALTNARIGSTFYALQIHKIKYHYLLQGGQNIADVRDYQQKSISQTWFSQQLGACFALQRWEYRTYYRREWRNGIIQPAAFGFDLLFHKNRTSILLIAQRKFRFPSFNDLYWAQGGNPQLLPEQGMNYSGEFSFQTNRMNIHLRPFYNNFHRIIQWSNSIGQWSANNVNNVRTCGSNFGINWSTRCKSWSLQSGPSLQWTIIAKQKSGKDTGVSWLNTPYSPKIFGSWNTLFKHKIWQINHALRYSSSRYTSIEESSTGKLSPYLLMDLGVGASFRFMHVDVTWVNCFNQSYENIMLYAMPGQFLQLNLNFIIEKE